MTTAQHVPVMTPRVWVGCLNCYNSGHLTGNWFDAVGADEITLAQVHAGARGPFPGCEEIWCLDTDAIPSDHEMGAWEASLWGEAYEQVGADLWPALCAWVVAGAYTAQADSDVPVVSDFFDAYCGHWPDFFEYAADYAESSGLMSDWPETATRYFDWPRWRQDLAMERGVTSAPAPEFGVYVFRNI